MMVQGISPAGGAGIFMPAAVDSESKALQKQIEEKQKELKELSSKEDIPLEEKVKQKQQLQQEITQLEAQLRMHQQEVKQQKGQENSKQDLIASGGDKQSLAASMSLSSEGTAMAGMESLLSAHSSLKQAKVQQGVSKDLQANARVLESEIKQDKNLGASVEKKEEQLEDLSQRSSDAMGYAAAALNQANEAVTNVKDGEEPNDEHVDEKKEDEETKLSMDDKQSKQEEDKEIEEK
ncbi:MAG: FlxA-like family protein [Lachnospira sp.]|nr:FlxA-like family protein [Lachnospira sp.]